MSDFDDRSRRLARKRYWSEHPKQDYTCPDCGRGYDEIVGEFQVHHKSGNPHDNRIDRLVGLCGFCHRLREGKKPSIERIKQYREHRQPAGSDEEDGTEKVEEHAERERPWIYTAGRMVWHNDEDSSYRASVEQRGDIDARFLHPQDTYFDHGGDIVSGCVAEDIDLVEKSDGVVALFDETDQIGTIVEVLHAAGQEKPTLALFSRDVTSPLTTAEVRSGRFDAEYPRALEGVSQRAESPLWFLINYLSGDSTAGRERTVKPMSARVPYDVPAPPNYEHDSKNTTLAVVQKDDQSISRALRSWVDNELETVDFPDPSPQTDLKHEAKEIADPRWVDE
jgi:nucleoside 2-deoxyribosyltransferase